MNLVDLYIEDNETAWAPSTLKSERSRLHALGSLIEEGPEAVYQHLLRKKKAPYTIKTTFIRLCAFEKWSSKMNKKLDTKYANWLNKHANRFKHAYQKEEIKVTYDEAILSISRLEGKSHEFAKSLLASGLRISEAYRVADGRVMGKGGKSRKVYASMAGSAPSKSSFSRALRSVGLKPHTLRKLCATRLAEAGATPADLCHIFGWTSIDTAYQYLQAREEDKIAALMEKVQKGS